MKIGITTSRRATIAKPRKVISADSGRTVAIPGGRSPIAPKKTAQDFRVHIGSRRSSIPAGADRAVHAGVFGDLNDLFY
jgi:hypothetical protein